MCSECATTSPATARSAAEVSLQHALEQLDELHAHGHVAVGHAPRHRVADDAPLARSHANLDAAVSHVDEPHFANAEREVRVALELAVVHPRGAAQDLDRQPVLGDLGPRNAEREPWWHD